MWEVVGVRSWWPLACHMLDKGSHERDRSSHSHKSAFDDDPGEHGDRIVAVVSFVRESIEVYTLHDEAHECAVRTISLKLVAFLGRGADSHSRHSQQNGQAYFQSRGHV